MGNRDTPHLHVKDVPSFQQRAVGSITSIFQRSLTFFTTASTFVCITSTAMSQSSASSTSPVKSSFSFNSGRASPFRRPESPSQARTITPTPSYQSTRPVTPSKLANSTTPTLEQPLNTRSRDLPISPTRLSQSLSSEDASDTVAPLSFASPKTTPRPLPSPATSRMTVNADSLSKLPAAQVREMREAFQILDQDSDGTVTREDVTEMLKSLGLESNASSLAPFFPASLPYPLPLPAYLSQLSSLLAPMSSSQELVAALSTFDDDDSGQIDIAELVQAVTNSRPESGERSLTQAEVEAAMEGFVGRRAFSAFGQSSKTRGDVFRYRDWVSELGAASDNQKRVAA